MPAATAVPEKRVLSLKMVLNRVPISRTTLWRLERKGLFPQRIQISENRVGSIEEDVTASIETKKGA